MQHQKKEINNTFIDFLVLLFSFFASIVLSVLAMLGVKKYINKKTYFYELLDFVFRVWPRSFFTKPSMYKITSFFGELLQYLFKR